jgi:GGDEF domain-containing protein
MSIREAQKYISNLKKRQSNPMLWPDYLTGLPDKHAVIMKAKEAYPKLGRTAISYIRIANINSYLIKYGSNHHAEIIQWAAAILKTCADKHECFVGYFGDHDFVAVCKKANVEPFLQDAEKLFDRKVGNFYRKTDLNRKSVLSFVSNGKKVTLGLMKLTYATIDGKTDIPIGELIHYLESDCNTP